MWTMSPLGSDIRNNVGIERDFLILNEARDEINQQLASLTVLTLKYQFGGGPLIEGDKKD